MKKLYIFLFFLGVTFQMNAQNFQLHYDLGEDRQHLTSTIEMFKPDKYGNTFFFVDFDYGVKEDDTNGLKLAYFEIARVIKTEKMPLGLHVEYNGGMGRFGNDPAAMGAFRINDAFLTGVDYSWNASDFSKGFTVKALFKHIIDAQDASFQLTGVWYWHMMDKKLTFTGFADFWRQDSDFNNDGKADSEFIFLTEPQLWYNFTPNIALGTELELSNNFAKEGFVVNPTIGAKWIF